MPTVLTYTRMVYTNLDDNNNKVWEIRHYDNGSFTTSWGRVGSELQTSEAKMGEAWTVRRMISEKRAKGYHEVIMGADIKAQSLALTQVAAKSPEDEVAIAVLGAANESIRTYLNVDIGQMSIVQLNDARNHMETRMMPGWVDMPYSAKKNLVEMYYRMIPTKLPAKIEAQNVVNEFDFAEQDQRLQQLEAGVVGVTLTGASVVDQLGGVQLSKLNSGDMTYKTILAHIGRASLTVPNIKGIYSVNLPEERKRWAANTRGREYVETLWHGTNSSNVRHILRSGLIVPSTASNGRRLGDGIYFSESWKRSMSYTSGYGQKFMFAASVALGKMYSTSGSHRGDKPITGYDSMHGTMSHSGAGDEYVVYELGQQTLRFLIWMEK